MKSLIKKLVEAKGPSGYESEVREIIRSEIEARVDEIYVDALGNLIAVKGKANSPGKKIMLAAHMDEIGLIATHVDENGFIRFTTIGGVRRNNLIDSHVRFLNGTRGVIGVEYLEDENRLPTFDQMFIDVGVERRVDCPIRTGDLAVFDQLFEDLGNRLVSKAMDDRIGVAILIEALHQIDRSPHQLFFVFSVQEEVGLRGATTASFRIDPDLGIALDVTRAGDTPKGLKMEVSLGKGPAIKVRDSGMLADPRVVDLLAKTAEHYAIPHQMEVLERGTTDARAMQLTRAGVPAGCISIPCRYIHGPSEMVDLRDVQNAVKLLTAILSSPIELEA